MHRLVLFSSFAFNPNLDQVLNLIFPKDLQNKKFGYMPANGVATHDTGIIDYWKSTAKEFQAEFVLIDNDPLQTPEGIEEQRQKFETINILLVSSGDAYPMLANLRKSGLDQYIQTFWGKSECILAGFSAGALLMTPSININKLRKQTEASYRKYTESQLKALNIVDFTVYPHYDKYRNKSILDNYRSTYPTEIKALPDDHWYIIEN